MGRPKDEQYLLIWVTHVALSLSLSLFECITFSLQHHYGPDRTLGDKENTYCLKLIKSISVRVAATASR